MIARKEQRTPHWHAAFIFFFLSSGFHPEIRFGAKSAPKQSHAVCLRDSYIPEILKLNKHKKLNHQPPRRGKGAKSVPQEGTEELS